MKKTKIVCTLGPASSTKKIIAAMADAGMNVVRLNFSHGLHEEHAEKIRLVKEVREENQDFQKRKNRTQRRRHVQLYHRRG